MTRGQKTLLVVLAVIVLSGGGFAWYWQATAVDRQVNALLDEVRTERPDVLRGILIQLGLTKDVRTERGYEEVGRDLTKLGPAAVPELMRALQDNDPSVPPLAALALEQLGDPRGVEFLVAALKDEHAKVRHNAMYALGRHARHMTPEQARAAAAALIEVLASGRAVRYAPIHNTLVRVASIAQPRRRPPNPPRDKAVQAWREFWGIK